MLMPGMPPLTKCPCGALIGINGEDVCDDCTCEPEYEDNPLDDDDE